MSSNSMNQTLTLRDGRTLGFAEYGDPEGRAVLHFHGGAGSRLERPVDESILTDLGIRYIVPDRPGHGLSSPQPNRALAEWPGDVAQLVNHLGVDAFHVLGWSAGGPHALACAWKLSNRVVAGAIVSGVAPPDRPNPYRGLPLQNRILLLAFRRMPKLVHVIRRGGHASIQGDPALVGSKLVSSVPPADRALLQVPENQNLMVSDIQEGYRQGWEGIAQDDLVINRPWGFRLEDIPVRIDVWQGEVDQNVPLSQGQYQYEKIPNSRLTIVSGQAHLFLFAKWREILTALVE